MFREIGTPLHVVALPPLFPPATGAAAESGGDGGEGGGEATGLRLFAEYTAVICRPDAYVALRVRRAHATTHVP